MRNIVGLRALSALAVLALLATAWHPADTEKQKLKTSWNLAVKLGPSVVWAASDQASWNDPRLPAIVVGRPLVE